MTAFTDIYNRFLGKITDDMYIELTPQDTIKDLRAMLIDALPNFEFPRCNLYDYVINEETKSQNELADNDFIIDISQDDELVVVENSSFAATLNAEEINILALLMMIAWLQRQVTSIENTRMKYSGADFKMTSQANHLSKLIGLLNECQRQSLHMQRLYKRRRINHKDLNYMSNWKNAVGHGVYY